MCCLGEGRRSLSTVYTVCESESHGFDIRAKAGICQVRVLHRVVNIHPPAYYRHGALLLRVRGRPPNVRCHARITLVDFAIAQNPALEYTAYEDRLYAARVEQDSARFRAPTQSE